MNEPVRIKAVKRSEPSLRLLARALLLLVEQDRPAPPKRTPDNPEIKR